MTDRELKNYAIIGLLVRIDAEKKKLKKSICISRRKQIKDRIHKMTEQYTEILNELMDKNPLE